MYGGNDVCLGSLENSAYIYFWRRGARLNPPVEALSILLCWYINDLECISFIPSSFLEYPAASVLNVWRFLESCSLCCDR